jgi:hypothetical protein
MISRQDTANAVYRDYNTDGVPSSGPHDLVKSEIRAYEALVNGDIVALQEGQTANALAYETWALLAAVTGTGAGQPAQVYGDAGTHTDPVVGGTVANSGQFRWSVSPAGWKRIDDTEYDYRARPNLFGDRRGGRLGWRGRLVHHATGVAT